MKVIVIGAGKVGYYLCKTLKEHSHTPILIDADHATCSHCADELGIKVIHGDGTSMEMLEAAGIQQDNITHLMAVTGLDEVNLVACQVARLQYGISKTIARINNPRNLSLASLFQVDIPICGTLNIANLLERQVDSASIKQLLSLNHGESTISELHLPAEGYPLEGMLIRDLSLPQESNIVSITRGDQLIIPRGHIRLQGGDRLLVLVSNGDTRALLKALMLDEKV